MTFLGPILASQSPNLVFAKVRYVLMVIMSIHTVIFFVRGH